MSLLNINIIINVNQLFLFLVVYLVSSMVDPVGGKMGDLLPPPNRRIFPLFYPVFSQFWYFYPPMPLPKPWIRH